MVHCNRCNTTADPVPPAFHWKALLVVYWISMVALTPLYCGLLGLNLIGVPLLFAMGGSIGTLSRLSTTWTCAKCGADVHTPARSERPRPVPARGHEAEAEPT